MLLHLRVELGRQVDFLLGPHDSLAVDDDVDALVVRELDDLRFGLLHQIRHQLAALGREILLELQIRLLEVDELLLELLALLLERFGLEHGLLLLEVRLRLLEVVLLLVEIRLLLLARLLERFVRALARRRGRQRALEIDHADLRRGHRARREATEERADHQTEAETTECSVAVHSAVHTTSWTSGQSRSSEALEEIADGELEHQRVFTHLLIERNTPLEAQRADRRDPPEAKADRLADAVRE